MQKIFFYSFKAAGHVECVKVILTHGKISANRNNSDFSEIGSQEDHPL